MSIDNRKKYSTSSKNPLIYGRHAVISALNNPRRKFHRIIVTKPVYEKNSEILDRHKAILEITEPAKISALLPQSAVHQGMAAEVENLPEYDVTSFLSEIADKKEVLIVALDQVTDPHNVGAILRSSAAFGVDGLLICGHNAPEQTSVITKVSSGGIEFVPIIRAGNFASTIKEFQKAGFWSIGLDGNTDKTISEIKPSDKTLLILGAEGDGLRRLTRENCDYVVKIPISKNMESLNVSNATAIALYQLKHIKDLPCD